MKTLINSRKDVRESGHRVSTDTAFTSRFVMRNLRLLDTALKAARISLRRGKNVALRTHAEFRRTIVAKRGAQ